MLRPSTVFVVPVILGLLGLSGPARADSKIPLPDLEPSRMEALQIYLDAHGQAPVDYVAGKFDDHDVVFLGEIHCIKQVGQFVKSLIPPLYERGVRVLATEFARREDQALIDSLLTGPEYDETLAREIVFRQFLHHGLREYVDLFKGAWDHNQTLKPEEPRFRILGINNSPDWSHVKTTADRDRDEVKRKVWHGETEEDWAAVVLDAVARGEKVLVYCGMHHAFTEYQMPVVNGSTGEFIRLYPERVGNYVYQEIGKRAITVGMHAPWPSATGQLNSAYPVNGVIDALMASLGPDAYPVGFDTGDGPFGELEGKGCLYEVGQEAFSLGSWCDGYVYLNPISEYQGMTPIPDFVNEENLERARIYTWDPRFRKASPGEFFWSIMSAANVQGRFRNFH